MKLYFLRHGEAVEAAEWKGDDASRPLTPDGRKILKKEAKALRALNLGLDVILTSPLLRAKETAAIVGTKLDIDIKVDDRLDSELNFERLRDLLKGYTDAKALMLVGHEPSMSAVASACVGGAAIDLKKGGIICIDLANVQAARGTLQWLVPPKLLPG